MPRRAQNSRPEPEWLGWQAPGAIERVAEALRSGAVVALPTETLYGLSCLATEPAAVARVAAMKGSVDQRGFVALLGGFAGLLPYVAADQDRRTLEFLRRVWPAALSAILVVRSPVPWGETRAGVHTAAFRVPAHAPLRALLGAVGAPVVSTSANRSGEPPLERPAEIVAAFGSQLAIVVTEEARAGPGTGQQDDVPRCASTLADCTVWPPVLLRAGAVDLVAALGRESGA